MQKISIKYHFIKLFYGIKSLSTVWYKNLSASIFCLPVWFETDSTDATASVSFLELLPRAASDSSSSVEEVRSGKISSSSHDCHPSLKPFIVLNAHDPFGFDFLLWAPVAYSENLSLNS